MTRKQISRLRTSPEHKKMVLAYARAPGGRRTSTWRKLRDFVAAQLRNGR